jgi:hypothetical protein
VKGERDLAVLSDTLASRGISAHLAATSRAVILLAGYDIVTAADGLYWWRTGRVREGRDIFAHHPASDPDGAARRLARRCVARSSGAEGLPGTPRGARQR